MKNDIWLFLSVVILICVTALGLPSAASASDDALEGDTMPAILTSITVDPPLVSGQTQQCTAQEFDQDGSVVAGADAIRVKSDNVTENVSGTAVAANLTITTVSLADGQKDVDYSQTLAATGGTPPYTWSMTTWSLPDGLSLTGDTISGTPTAAGIFSFTIVVTDNASPIPNTAAEDLSITISPAAPTPANLSITTVSLADGQESVDYSQTLAAAGGTPPYTWTIPTESLPDGLYLNADIISGTPTSAGVFYFTVAVTDSASPIPNTAAENLTITIIPEAPTTRFIVRLVAGLSTAAQQQVIARNGGVETSSVPVLKMHFIKVSNASIDEVLQRYQSDPEVRSIEYDTVYTLGETPSDPSYPDEWALPKIHWDSVFGTVFPTGSSIIAILDTGIDASHPDLSGIVLPGYSAFEGSDAWTDPNGHGTKMAGITAALTDNGLGVAGVAYAGVSLLPIQILGADGTGQDSDVINGIVWAVESGANVILMAFSNPDYSLALQEAIDYAWDNGVILVAAAGNNGLNTVTYPAGDRGVIGVSATDPDDALFPSSNYGQLIFLAAPGVNLLTTGLNGDYTTVSGTSAAAAMVAGAAAFMHAVDPSLSNGVIVGRLARTADPAGTQEQTGNGRVNMWRALSDTGMDSVEPEGAAPLGDGGPFIGPYTAAAIITSTANGGTWATGSTWVGGIAPVATDTVVIATTGSNYVTLGASATCAGLTVNEGAVLEFNAGTYGLTVNGNVENYGTITVTNHSGYNAHVLSFTGNFTCPGEFDGGSTLDDVLNLTISGTGTQYISGFTITYLPGFSEYSSNLQTITMAKTGGMATLTGDIIGGHALVINGSGGTLNLGEGLTHTFSVRWTRTNGTLNGGSSLFRVGGSISGTGGTFTAGTGTVEYYASAAQTCAAVTYNNLILSGSGAKSFSNTTVNGVLSMEGTATVSVQGSRVVTYGGSATLQYNTATARTVSAEEWITPFAASGGVIITNTGTITLNANKVFNASVPLTIESGATLATNNRQLTFGGDFINNGGTFNAGSSAIVIANTMADQSIDGFTTTGTVSMTKTGGTATFNGDVNGGALTINGSGGTLDLGTGLTHTFTGAWTRTNGTLDGGSSTLRIGGNASGSGGTFTANTGTVEWYASGAQTVAAVAYNNLTLSGSGAKTMTGVNTIGGDLTISGSATMTGNAGFTVTGALNYGSSGSTTLTASTPISIGTFSQTAGTLVDNGNNITVTGSGADTWTKSGGTFTATGTVTFTGPAPEIDAFSFNNLTISDGNGNTALITGNITISATLTLTSGTLAVDAYTLTLNGPTIAGTPTNLDTTSSSSLSFGGSSAGVNIPSSVTELYNLTINNSNGITLNSNLTINGVLTFTSGNLLAGSYTVIIPAGGTVSRTSGYVIGNLQKYVVLGATSRTFEVGTASAYNPVDVVFGSVTTAGELTVKVTSGQHSNNGTSLINSNKNVNEYWSLTNSGIVFNTCNVTFTFVAGDILGGANPDNFIVGQYDSGWTYPTVGTKTATSTQATGITSFSDFCVGEMIIPPTVNSVTLVDNSMTPQVEYTVTVNVGNDGGKTTLDTLVLKLWYDSSGSDYSESTFDAMSADTQDCAIITWTKLTDSFDIEPSSSTTWALGVCSSPGSLPGDFIFRFTVGKVATATAGSARWQVAAKVSNYVAQTGYNYDSTAPTMNWYGEITINTGNVNWASAISLGSGFTDNTTNRITGISITYICNGNYNIRVKASSLWSGSGKSITLANNDTPGYGEFALKADDDDTLNDAVLVLSSDYTTFSTGTQTYESGDTVADNSLWLKLGASGIPEVLYSGTIYYEITPG